ncbi:MAG: LytTR family DNA-binding domain-containing protein [Bacteroidales bacterium]|nr:LytTR family DNA-binding domain-containing protein [Bacteroidales bacterium]
MKAYIIEDDPITVEVLKNELIKLEFEIVGVADSIAQVRKDLFKLKIDLCLADIQLADGNIFELLDEFPKIPFAIIFITAYEKFAIKAIKLSAIDYILKPIDYHELQEALENFIQSHTEGQNTDYKPNISMASNYYLERKSIQKILISNNYKYESLPLKEVMYISSSGSYSIFNLSNGSSTMSSKPLQYYEKLLQDEGFIRIHNQHIVNVQFIKGIIRKNNLTMVQLYNNETLPVSRFKKKDFMKYFFY